MRRIVIYAEANLEPMTSKTAAGVIAYRADEVVAVIDSTKTGMDAVKALDLSLDTSIPVVADVQAALAYEPDTLLIGMSPAGITFPADLRVAVRAAIDVGMDVINGLHSFLSEDAELSALAAQRSARIWDVRRPPPENAVALYRKRRTGSKVVLTVGSDTFAGKMTTALELTKEARERRYEASFLATGQIGIMISDDGLPADHVLSDFLCGHMERLTHDRAERHDWVFVEGQGALNSPSASPVTLGLIHGSLPDAMIFCHKAGARYVKRYPDCTLPSLSRLIEMNEQAPTWIHARHRSPVVGISVITRGMPEREARRYLAEVADETGRPTTDIRRFGSAPLMNALEQHFRTGM